MIGFMDIDLIDERDELLDGLSLYLVGEMGSFGHGRHYLTEIKFTRGVYTFLRFLQDDKRFICSPAEDMVYWHGY